MKCLKIENGQGYYCVEEDSWKALDVISKDDILRLVDLITDVQTQCEMQEYDSELITNKAHNVIYKSLYGKLMELLNSKTRFVDEANRLYKDAIDKYCCSDD